ncbi:MAG: hypothetical protein ABL958_03050 [Bdellovibrionia bacterium]
MIRVFLVGALLALPASAFASGKFFADIYAPVNNKFSRPLTQATANLWLDFNHQIANGESPYSIRGIWQSTIFEGNNSVVTGKYEPTHYEGDFREGYLSYLNGGFEFRAGNLIVPWGKSDGLNPTDYLSARDYRHFSPDSEVQRKPGSGFWASWTPETATSWNFTAALIPYFAEGQFVLAPGVVPANVAISEAEHPGISSSSLEGAVKAAYTGDRWDISVNAYNGFNHYPEFQEEARTIFTPVDVRLRLKEMFRRQSAAGGDFSWSGDTWIYRAEAAYFWTENQEGANMMSVPSHYFAVVGFERPFWDNFRMQVQYAHKYFPAYRPIDEMTGASPVDAAVKQQIARTNAMLFQYQERDQGTVTFRVSYAKESSGWDAEIFFMENLRGQDFLVRPKTSYAWSDNLRYTLGADIYGGPGHRTLGAMSAFNSVFAEAKYSF